MAIRYSQTVLDHFSNPRNVGEIENPDGIGEVGNPACGDIMTFHIRVNSDDRIEDVKFKTFGCGAAIAVSSMISEMAKNKTLDEALNISNKDVADKLEGLPVNKLHCSNLGADALHAAIRSCKKKMEQRASVPEKVIVEHNHSAEKPKEGSTCRCPYCEIDTPADVPYCAACGHKIQTATDK